MKKINGNDKIYSIVKENPEIRDVLVSLGMTPIADDKNLNTIGRLVNLKQALKQVSVSKNKAQDAMKQVGIEVEFNE